MAYLPVPGGTSQAEQKHIKRLLHSLASLHATTHTLQKQCTVSQQDKNTKRSWILPVITGQTVTQFNDCRNIVYIHNISLKDAQTEEIFLQRFCPATLSASESMTESFTKGSALFWEVMEKARCKRHKAASRQTLKVLGLGLQCQSRVGLAT